VINQWLPLPDHLAKLLFDFEASYYPFTIQNTMWLIFFIGLAELTYRYLQVRGHKAALSAEYLPTDPQKLLVVDDMKTLYRLVKQKDNELAALIRNLSLRFQAGHSVAESHQMLNSQLELWQFQMDIQYSLVRYLSWLIPTLGFIGTVLGIAQTLQYASCADPNANTLLMELTRRLGGAFDTTLLALIMSAILMFGIHMIQSWEEKTIALSGQYCLDNFITRLYLQK